MEKTWQVELELHGKKQVVFASAMSDIDAVQKARTVAKDWCNVAHIISAKTI